LGAKERDFSQLSGSNAGITGAHRMRVLIVEDERKMAELLKEGLEEENHLVSVAFDGRAGLESATSSDFDAIVLDLMLPGLDGFEVARRLRRRQNQTPILVLTARDGIADIAKALDLGADDYLKKPFSFVELLARLRALARRGSSPRPPLLKVADLVLDPASRRVSRGSYEIHLSPTEYRLLEILMRRAGRVVSRETIVNSVWGLEQDVEENTLDAFVRLLRSKVDKGFDPKLIQTVRGIGYSVSEEPKS
jgi:DNA-binding response OmpR family regulator